MTKEVEKGCLAELLKQTRTAYRKRPADDLLVDWAEWYAGYMVDQRGLYFLGAKTGKAVQEILNRYVNEELRPALGVQCTDPDGTEFGPCEEDEASIQKDIDYIEGLAKLFD